MDPRPIGIFDSGLGGLTAAKALEKILPGENLIYFGDSANAPYGVRSSAELERMATANAAFLASFDVKAVLVACGTVSSTVIGRVREKFSFPLFGVVDAPCRAASALTKTGRVAVAATEASIRSGAFARALKAQNPALEVFPKACQSLVSTVEAGHFSAGDPIAEAAVAAELEPIRAFCPDTLMLGCTHFPLLHDAIAAYMGPGVALVNVSEETAKALRDDLIEHDLCSDREIGDRRWFTSGSTEEFARYAGLFLGHAVTPERHVNSLE